MESIQRKLPLSSYFLASNTIASSTNTMEIFANEEFGKVRVIKHNGEPWFVARDVAAALGYERNILTQRSMDRELFVVKEGCVIGNDGESHITKTPKVTGKGQLYFMNRFKEITERAVT